VRRAIADFVDHLRDDPQRELHLPRGRRRERPSA
jgi:hypothetical protein